MYTLPEQQRGFVNDLASSGRGRNNQLSMAIAKAVSDKQLMPSSPVDELDSYYIATVMLPVSKVISDINELVIIDTANVERYARLFYKARYRMLYPVGYIMDSSDGHNAKLNFLGVGTILTHDMMSCLNEDFPLVIAVYNGVSKLIHVLSGQHLDDDVGGA